MFVAAFAHACLYGYKVMYPTEALPETVMVITIASDTESNADEEEVEGDSGQSDPDAKKRMNPHFVRLGDYQSLLKVVFHFINFDL